VSPSRFDITTAGLSAEGGGAALLKAVQEQVERRRSFDQPGEPPVRIIIRFVIHKDSLRVYHQVYPLLDSVPAEKRAVLASE
jgi:hypothetical protein